MLRNSRGNRLAIVLKHFFLLFFGNVIQKLKKNLNSNIRKLRKVNEGNGSFNFLPSLLSPRVRGLPSSLIYISMPFLPLIACGRIFYFYSKGQKHKAIPDKSKIQVRKT